MEICEHTDCPNRENCHSDNPDITLGCVPDNNTPLDKAKFYIERGDLNPESDFAVICQALINTEKRQASGLENHVILYAKGHYGNSGNIIEDLREIISTYAWIELEHVSEKDVKKIIISAFERFVREHDKIQALERGLSLEPIRILNMNIYESMLGKLSIILGKYCNLDKKLDLRFDKKYVIHSEEECAYWDNDQGWVGRSDCTIFSYDEKRRCNLPVGGEWLEHIA